MQTTIRRHSGHSRKRAAAAIASAGFLWIACLATAASVAASDGTTTSAASGLTTPQPASSCAIDPAESADLCAAIPPPSASSDPEPIDSEPLDSEPSLPGTTGPEPIDSEPLDSEPSLPVSTDPEPIDSEPGDPEPSLPVSTDPEPIDSGSIESEPLDSEPSLPGATGPEPIDSEPIDAEPSLPVATDPEADPGQSPPVATGPLDAGPADLEPNPPAAAAPIDSEPPDLAPSQPSASMPGDPELGAPSPSIPTVPESGSPVVPDLAEPGDSEPGTEVSTDTSADTLDPVTAAPDQAAEESLSLLADDGDDAGLPDAPETPPTQVADVPVVVEIAAHLRSQAGPADPAIPAPEPNRKTIPRGIEAETGLWGSAASVTALIAAPLARVPPHVVLPAPALWPAAVSAAGDLGRAGGGWSAAILFNLWLRRQLRERRMTQRQLAARSGVNHSTISRLLTGDRMPSLNTATKLARALRKIGEDNDVARYFDDLTEAALVPTQRVEAALRGDEDLEPQDVREVLNTYLRLRARRRRDKVSH